MKFRIIAIILVWTLLGVNVSWPADTLAPKTSLEETEDKISNISRALSNEIVALVGQAEDTLTAGRSKQKESVKEIFNRIEQITKKMLQLNLPTSYDNNLRIAAEDVGDLAYHTSETVYFKEDSKRMYEIALNLARKIRRNSEETISYIATSMTRFPFFFKWTLSIAKELRRICKKTEARMIKDGLHVNPKDKEYFFIRWDFWLLRQMALDAINRREFGRAKIAFNQIDNKWIRKKLIKDIRSEHGNRKLKKFLRAKPKDDDGKMYRKIREILTLTRIRAQNFVDEML